MIDYLGMKNIPNLGRKTHSISLVVLIVIVGLFVSSSVASAAVSPATHPVPVDSNHFWIFNPNPNSLAGVTATMYRPMSLSVITYKAIPLTWKLVEVKRVSGSTETTSVDVPGVGGTFPASPAKKFSTMNANMVTYVPMNISSGWYYFKVCSGEDKCQASKVFKVKDAPAPVSDTRPNPSAVLNPAAISPISPADQVNNVKAKVEVAPAPTPTAAE